MLSRKSTCALGAGLVVALTAVGAASAAKPTETWTVVEHDVTLPPQFYPAEPNGLCGPYPATWETFTNKTQMNHLTARPDGSFVFKDFETGLVEVDYVDPTIPDETYTRTETFTVIMTPGDTLVVSNTFRQALAQNAYKFTIRFTYHLTVVDGVPKIEREAMSVRGC
jgi:hypothetical protein